MGFFVCVVLGKKRKWEKGGYKCGMVDRRLIAGTDECRVDDATGLAKM